MKVRGLESCAGLDFSISRGSLADLPEEIALSLINHKLAEAVTDEETTGEGTAKGKKGKKKDEPKP